jgi:hypothetical protein
MIKELETLGKAYVPYTGQSGLYVSRVPEPLSQERLVDLVHKHGLCQMTDRDISELHCTIMYSPAGLVKDSNVPDRQDTWPVPMPCAARVIRFEVWPGHNDKGYLVAILESSTLQSIHRLWRLRGGVSTFPTYIPHISVQSPFPWDRPERGFILRLNKVNEELAHSPMLIRLYKETVEDIH